MRWRPRWGGALLIVSAALTTAAQGQPASLWDHNGSVVGLYADGTLREFRYEQPRAGIQAEGVTAGTTLFAGVRSGDTYSGTAYVFSRRCGAVAYPVSGSIASDERRITLYGNAPSRLDSACRAAAIRQDVLQFEFLQSLAPSPGESGAVAEQAAARERELAERAEAAERQARVERERHATEEGLRQLREQQERQAREARDQQELANRARREREQEERRLGELRAYSAQREHCRQYIISACDAALASGHATEQDRRDAHAWRAAALQFSADFSACQGGSVQACDAAAASPAASEDNRRLVREWRIAASPLDRVMSLLPGVLRDGPAAAFHALGSTQTAVGIAIFLALAIGAGLLRWRPQATAGVRGQQRPPIVENPGKSDPIVRL